MKKPMQDFDADGVKEMLKINQAQQEFYDSNSLADPKQGNLVTKLWRKARRSQYGLRDQLGIDKDVYDLHWQWMGDTSDMRVLDLGCFEGNPTSMLIAEKCKSYTAIDLSSVAIDNLNKKIEAVGLTNARGVSGDFLSHEFDEKFDLIYCHSVAHHFKHFEGLLERLEYNLAANGSVITLDPLQTSLPLKILRALYRPFQQDADWEWPFRKSNFDLIRNHFDIVGLQGFMGLSKWTFPLALFSEKTALKYGQRMHQKDLALATDTNRSLWRCMHVTMHWKPRKQ